MRTNYFQRPEARLPPTISFKIDSKSIEGLPEPKPFAEIFVYAPEVEGVHLRFGRIARGGIRWSDRPEDFRTEVLGLAKAQNVKNVVIVPVGAKGGFVPKAPAGRVAGDAMQAEGVRAYKRFISSLLDLTDNLKGEAKSCRQRIWCGATAMIPISSLLPTRARPASPISPMKFRPNMASGSTMPSRPAARPDMTTRRWASPRAAAGKR